ncbi:MAG: hypothetical protein FWD28_02660 [Treponema sp.]|nr:hypothetical protein [Treponema sp.]
MSENKKLDFIGTFKEGIGIGLKNIVPIIVNFILFILTCWIPHFGGGVIIGFVVGVMTKASKGETIPMTEVFDAKYRKFMGEYFLTNGLMAAGAAMAFTNAISLVYAWRFAAAIAVDKGKGSSEAITLSNLSTYGSKFLMFIIDVLVCIVIGILASIFMMIPGIGWLLCLLVIIVFCCVYTGINASIYKQLTSNI